MTDNLPDIPDSSGMDMFNNYQAIEVNATKDRLKIDARKFVEQLCNVYLQTDKIQRPEYVESIAKIESLTLSQLLGQVKYAEHSLDSLMRQLDSGGFTDASTYKMIMEMQKNSIDITMRVSQFVRSLPEYFKHLEEDITKYQSMNLIKQGTSTVQDSENGKEYEVDEYSSEHVYRGTHDLMKRIEEARKAKEKNRSIVEQEISTIQDVEPIDSSGLVEEI